jgi:hypothetical protein
VTVAVVLMSLSRSSEAASRERVRP